MGGLTLEKAKSMPVTLGLLAALATAGYLWISQNFVTVANAADYESKLTKMVEANGASIEETSEQLKLHVKNSVITAALQMVEAADAKVDRKRQIKADSETIEEAEAELSHAILYRDCVLNEKPNCSQLSQPGIR